jgi:hypothetical protein
MELNSKIEKTVEVSSVFGTDNTITTKVRFGGAVEWILLAQNDENLWSQVNMK